MARSNTNVMRLSRSFFVSAMFALTAFCTSPISALQAQTFAPVPGLSFTKALNGANPLPQVLPVASAKTAAIDFTLTFSTSSGGDWLSVTGLGCSPKNGCGRTPAVINVVANPDITLAAGSYTGQIIVTSGTVAMTIPVTLSVIASTGPFLDTLPGGLTYSMATAATTIPPPQQFQIRNAGAGTLNWSASVTTADGGSWLGISSPSGSAPAYLTATLKPAALPGGGLVAGSYIGILTVQSAASTVTIPISVTVGTSVLNQISGLSFNKPFAGSDPLPQVLTMGSTGAAIDFTATFQTSRGGNWLSISGLGCSAANGCGSTPEVVTAIVTTSPTMPAGTYTGQIVVTSGTEALVIPVSLSVGAPGDTFFDSLPGHMSFSMKTAGSTLTSQPVQVRGAGSGVLNWTLSTTTSDGGRWLSTSATNGVAPSAITVSVTPGALPNAGLVAGTFTGQLLFQAGNVTASVPVSVVVGANVLTQMNGISFTKTFAGADPLPQVLPIASTGSHVDFSTSFSTGGGGDWLSVTGLGCSAKVGCGSTPQVISIVVKTSVTLPAGTYLGQVVVSSGSMAVTVPVTLTVGDNSTPLFDNVPGHLSFLMKTAGTTPPSQSFQLRNVGSGNLNWTLAQSTADGGNWLNVSSTGGATPSTVTVSISPNLLPSGGLVAGTYNGLLSFQSSSGGISVPITVTVGDNVFTQLNGLTFTKQAGGADPLAQSVSLSGTGTGSINFTASAFAGNGGSWLSFTGLGCSAAAGCGSTPQAVTIKVINTANMPAGSYTGEVVFNAGTLAMVLPVALNIVAAVPNINSVVPVFSGNSGFNSNTYLAIYGTQLSTTTRAWDTAFSGNNAPTTLEGVGVTVNGLPAFIQYVSPGQININTPDDATTGPVVVQVKNASGTSTQFNMTRTRLSPTLLSDPTFNQGAKKYVIAQTADFSKFIGPPNLVANAAFTAAKPGDTIIIFAIGCGPTTPATPAGVIASQNATLALPFQAKIGGIAATVPFAGLLAGTVGLYQLNIVVPKVAAGDQTIEFTVDGVPNAQGLVVRTGQ